MRCVTIVITVALLSTVACGTASPPSPTPRSSPASPATPSSETGAVAVLELDGTPGQGVAPDTEKFNGGASYSKDASAKVTDIRWDFGDGSPPAEGAKVSHTFHQPGTFAVTLSVTDSDGSTGTASLSVQITAPLNPAHTVIAIARLDGTPGEGAAPDTEAFDGTASHADGGGATLAGCQWTFGDGATADGCRATHTFQDAGDFTVTLTATDSDGASGTATLVIHVTAPATRKGVVAVATLDGTPGRGAVPDTERFDGSASHSRDPAASLASCGWDFGDGASAMGCQVDHTFTTAGLFTVTLTATDTQGASATATLEVQVDAKPAGSVRWDRSLPSTPQVGTDWADQVAVTFGATVASLDPESGATVWSNSYPDPPSAVFPFALRGPVFILPGSGELYSEGARGGPYASANVCHYRQDGTQTCVAGWLEDEGHGFPLSMAPTGELSWGFSGFIGVTGTLALSDGATWTAQLSDNASSAVWVDLMDTAAEPGGDLVIAAVLPEGFSYGGEAIPAGPTLMRLNAQAQVVWAEPIPFRVLDLGTTRAGTVVALVQSSQDFTWGNGHASGTALVVTESDGTPRWVRPLDAAESGQLAVLPMGRLAISTNPSDCAGSVVYRFDLAGNQEWRHDFAAQGCDLTLSGVAIRPHDVLVSGTLAQPADLGRGPLSAGGFVIDLEGGD